LRVLFGAFLGVDGEGAEIRGERLVRVQPRVEIRVCALEPFLAFLGRAAVFTVLWFSNYTVSGSLVDRPASPHVIDAFVPTSGGRLHTPQ
jgi:hypothetical protein